MSVAVSGRRFTQLILSVFLALAATFVLAPAPAARAAISLEEGADTVTTPKFEWDFGNAGGVVEWVSHLHWRDSAGNLSGELPAQNGVSGGPCGGAPTEFWGQSYGNSDGAGPAPVVTGSFGTWTARGGRSVELDSAASTECSGDSPPIPVRTRYTFFDSGAAANMVRMERRWSFALAQAFPNPAQGLRAYVPRLPVGTYNQEIYPKGDGSALITDGVSDASPRTDWNGTWMAINASPSESGVLLLRDPADLSPARIVIDYDASSGSNNSGITLDRPLPSGWAAPLTETEYLCFYDATSWPPGERSPTRLPDGCSPKVVPINTAPPTLSAGAGNPRSGEQFTATSGTWDNTTGSFGYQWSRCLEAACTPIGQATGTTYTATASDVGSALKVTVIATAPGGETDSAESNVSGSISGHVYEGEAAPAHLLSGASVQVCRRSGTPCRSTFTDANGFYRVQVPVSGKYRVTAYPPASSKASSHTRSTVARVQPETEKTGQDVILPLPKLPPPQVSFSGSGVRGKTAEGVPVVHWQEPFTLEYETDIEDEVEAKVDFADGQSLRVLPEQPVGPSPKNPEDGIFMFSFQPLYPNHGAAKVTIIVRHPESALEEEEARKEKEEEEAEEQEEEQEEEEEDEEEEQEEEEPEEEESEEEEQQEEEREGEEEKETEEEEEHEKENEEPGEGPKPGEPEEIEFPLYIDPSGLVSTTTGAPLAGVKVSLYEGASADGPFTLVPNGSAVMSPMNRTNPDLSEGDGHFGWDVIAGFYKVSATKEGCHAPSDPGSAVVETGVMTIPPPVVNLDLRLECPAPKSPGETPSAAPTVERLPTPIVQTPAKPLKCRKGFVKKKVKGKQRCVKHPKKKKKKKR